MQIVKGNTENLDEVLNVFLLARGEMEYLPTLHTPEETKEFIFSLLKKGNTYIAKDMFVVGFVTIEEGWIEHLYIHPKFQNKGIGKSLLDTAKKLPPGGLQLWVFEDNVRAIKFYEREGLKLIKKRDRKEQDNEEGLPDRLYKWVT